MNDDNAKAASAVGTEPLRLAESLRHLAAAVDAHAGKFPVPDHMRVAADNARAAADYLSQPEQPAPAAVGESAEPKAIGIVTAIAGDLHDMNVIRWYGERPAIGAKLYTAPPPSPDVAALQAEYAAYVVETNQREIDFARKIGDETVRVEALQAENERLRSMLFPYADATEIGGMSWNGFYLIGDNKSVKELRCLEHRSSQLKQFSAAYDESVAREKARAEASEAKIADLQEALTMLVENIEHACPSLKRLGPFANARAALSRLKQEEQP